MKFTIVIEYENGAMESQNKIFENWASAEHYADKQKERLEVKAVWIR